jgi:FAD/FMN-containing dehydrogenase
VTTAPARSQPPISREYPYYVLLEAMGSDEGVVEAALTEAYEKDLICDAVLAQSEGQRQQLWGMRDDVEQCFRDGPTIAFDVSLRISDMEGYVAEVERRLAEAFERRDVYIFGHMGDGNLHLVIGVGAYSKEIRRKVESSVYEPLRAIGGSVSAEHGVGLEKKPYLDISRSTVEIQLMRTLKKALDPKGILNPGKIFDLPSGDAEAVA